MDRPNPNAESDPRFPSGKWVGFWTDRRVPGKHQMEMVLSFADGNMNGSGRDWIGAFNIDGGYSLDDGQCIFVKQYVGMHGVGYRGFNEGKGIWGTWEILVTVPDEFRRGGFHIWPEGQHVGSGPELTEEADAPLEEEIVVLPGR